MITIEKVKKKANNIDYMLSESPLKLIIKLSLPAIAISLIDELNSIIDAVFMGRYFGSEAISSMAVILPIMTFMIAIAMLFSEGSSIAIARYLGAKRIGKANEYFTTTVIVTLVMSVIVGLSFYFFLPWIIDFFNISETVKYYAEFYLKILSLGMPIFMLLLLLAKIVYTEGKTKILLCTSIFQLFMNVIINYLLIAILGFGVIGAAVGTLISELIQIVILFRFINSDSMIMSFSIRSFRISKAYLKELFYLGFPISFSMLLLSFTMGIESKVISNYGINALSVQTITGYVFSISGSVAGAIMGIALVIMSYSVGAKKEKRFFKTLKITSLIVFLLISVINLMLIFNSELLVTFFTNSSVISQKIRIPALIYGLSSPFIFTTNVLLYAMQAVGMEWLSTYLFTLQQTVLFIPLLFILAGFSFNLAISAQPISEIIGGLITLCIIPVFIKKSKEYILKKKEEYL